MGTVVGAVVGAAIGGPYAPLLGAIGAAIGSLYDNLIIIPALLADEGPPPGLGNNNVNFADEGASVFYCYGAQTRVGANTIMASNQFFTGGGGGGKRGAPSQITWWRDVVFEICSNETKRITRIDFDGEAIYVRDPNFLYNLVFVSTPNFVIYFDAARSVQLWTDHDGNNNWDLQVWYMTVENPPTGGVGGQPIANPNLALFTSGQTVDIEHKDSNGNTVSYPAGKLNPWLSLPVIESRVVGTVTNGGVTVPRTRLVVDFEAYIQHNPGPFKDRPGRPGNLPPILPTSLYPFEPWPVPGGHFLEIDQVGTRWFPNSASPSGTFFYHAPGDSSQTDPNYQARRGSADAPALPGKTYVSVHNLNESMHGNRTPQMQAYVDEVVATGPVVHRKLSYMLDRLMLDHAGITEHRFTTTFDPDVRGLKFTSLTEISRVVGPLMIAYDLYVAEHQGKLWFMDRASRGRPLIDANHLDARPFGDEPEKPIPRQDIDEAALPNRIHVRFDDVDKDLQPGAVHSPRSSTLTSSFVTRQVSLPISMDAATAKGVARRLLHDAHGLAGRFERVKLPYWYLDITPTDIASFVLGGRQIQGQDWFLFIDRVDRGEDMYLHLEGSILEEAPGAAPTGFASPPGEPLLGDRRRGVVPDIPPAIAVVLDIPPLLDAHMSTAGVYVAWAVPAGGAGPTAGYRITRDLGDGTTFYEVGEAGSPAVMGRVVGRLPEGATDVTDWTHSLTVELLGDDRASGKLAGVSADEIEEGANLAAVSCGGTGWELIQFQSVEELPSSTERRWRLTGLRRALYGSEAQMELHTDTSDWFVLLDRTTLRFLPIDLAHIGTTLQFKVVGAGKSALNGAPVRAATIAGRSSLSLPVAHLSAQRRGNGDLDLTWTRRTRARYRTFGTQAPPLVEITESYDVVIRQGSSVIRTYAGVTTPSKSYTAADQTTDTTTGEELSIDVYQNDSVRGRGQVATIDVAQAFGTLGTEDGNELGTEDGRTMITATGA